MTHTTACWPASPASTPPSPRLLTAIRGQGVGSGNPGHPPTPLAAKLKSLRIEAAMLQAELATAVGCAPKCVSEWENGRHIPALTTLQRYAAVFNTTVSHLLEGVM